MDTTKSKHTPGPWRVSHDSPMIFGAERGPGMEPLGFVYGPTAFPERSEYGQRAMADARLIAAAPEMLAALQHIMRCIGTGTATIHWDSSTWHQIDAAIAKATGGAE